MNNLEVMIMNPTLKNTSVKEFDPLFSSSLIHCETAKTWQMPDSCSVKTTINVKLAGITFQMSKLQFTKSYQLRLRSNVEPNKSLAVILYPVFQRLHNLENLMHLLHFACSELLV